MNCRQAIRLLPLWIGRDLADASESEDLREHLAECQSCAGRRFELQASLEALQSISTGRLGSDGSVFQRPSMWPRLALMLSDVPKRRDHFNGWIPAAAMAMAAGVMFSVSILQFQREMGDVDPTAFNSPSMEKSDERDLFRDKDFASGAPVSGVHPRGLVKFKQPANNNW